MNFQSIENYITQFPIYQYTFLSIDDIESSVAEVPDYSNMDALLATKQEHEEITAKIEAFLKQDAWRCYTLSTDSCSICEKCTYPKKSCNHPDLMHPCIESHGILLTKNIEENHMDYYMGEQMVLWFSLIFLREA